MENTSHFVIMDNALSDSFVQHLLVPLLQAFWLWDLLVCWVTMEDVIIPFTGWTGPDMTCCKPDTGKDEVAFIIKTCKCVCFYFICLLISIQLKRV